MLLEFDLVLMGVNIVHRIFISYHHHGDQAYKDSLLRMNLDTPVFVDGSVDTGDISDDLPSESIRIKIRDEYLRESSVTILLVGLQTKRRKHVDWEVFSSMIDGKKNKRSGIIVITLPPTNCTYYTAAHEGEKSKLYPENSSWVNIDDRSEYERRYPYIPDRIIDNLLKPGVKISITTWDRVFRHPDILEFLIESAYRDRNSFNYDTSREMRRNNS